MEIFLLDAASLLIVQDGLLDAVDYAKFFSRSHDAVIRVYDEHGNVIETHEHAASDNLIGGCWSLRFSKRLD